MTLWTLRTLIDIGFLTNRPHKIWCGCPPGLYSLKTQKQLQFLRKLKRTTFCAKFLLTFKDEQQKAS